MRTRTRDASHGYSVIELLVVLFIVAILAAGLGTYSLWPRQRPAVKDLLNEIEGLVAQSHQFAGTNLGNVVTSSTGSWGARTYQISFQPKSTGVPVATLRADGFDGKEYAGVDTGGGMTTAVGGETLLAAIQSASPDLLPEFTSALGNPLGVAGATAELNAYNKQYLNAFCVPIVGLRGTSTYSGAPAGYVVVVKNRIYKFYKAGPGAENPWRRM